MPLIVIAGAPCSGKSRRARELKKHFQERQKQVEVVSEDEVTKKLGYEKNETYLDAQKEKRMREMLKSEVVRLIGKHNLVILDGSNYIKGYRYELYCAAKASKSTQCTIYTIKNAEEARRCNVERREKQKDCPGEESIAYTDEVFDALMLRFEEPNGQHRWDSPLFTVQPTDELDMDAVHCALYENKPPPPNMSTQNLPLNAPNFLYELDRVTQLVSAGVLEARRKQSDRLPEYPDCTLEPALVECAVPQRLLQLRRQFLKYASQRYSATDINELGRHYIRYLNNTVID